MVSLLGITFNTLKHRLSRVVKITHSESEIKKGSSVS